MSLNLRDRFLSLLFCGGRTTYPVSSSSVGASSVAAAARGAESWRRTVLRCNACRLRGRAGTRCAGPARGVAGRLLLTHPAHELAAMLLISAAIILNLAGDKLPGHDNTLPRPLYPPLTRDTHDHKIEL